MNTALKSGPEEGRKWVLGRVPTALRAWATPRGAFKDGMQPPCPRPTGNFQGQGTGSGSALSPGGPVTGHRMCPQLIPEAPLPGGPGAPHLRGTPDKRLPDTEQRGARKTETTPLRLTVKHPHPQQAEGLRTKSGASQGGVPAATPPLDPAHDPQEAAASRGVPQAGSKDCQQCPQPQPPRLFLW